jgi:hypothetical protein
LGAEITLIAQQLPKCLDGRLEESIAAPGPVVLPHLIELMRQRKDHMEMITGQKSFLDLLQPVVRQPVVAARATAMPTGVVCSFDITIIMADPLFVTEFITLTAHDGARRFVLLDADAVSVFVIIETAPEYILQTLFHEMLPFSAFEQPQQFINFCVCSVSFYLCNSVLDGYRK